MEKISPDLARKAIFRMDLPWGFKWEIMRDYSLEHIYREVGLDDELLHGVYVGGRRTGRTTKMLVRVALIVMEHQPSQILVVGKNMDHATDLFLKFLPICDQIGLKINHRQKNRIISGVTDVIFTAIRNENALRGHSADMFFDHTAVEAIPVNHYMEFMTVYDRSSFKPLNWSGYGKG